MSSLFEQWKADHTALTLESWLVKRILEWQDSKDGMIQDSIEQSDRLTCKIDELEAQVEGVRDVVRDCRDRGSNESIEWMDDIDFALEVKK